MTRPTQAERRAATINALIGATLECLATEGFQGTSTRRVAERAGVSQGALQHHFTSKASLIDAAMNRIITGLVAETAATADPSASEEQRLVTFLDALWEAFTRPTFGVVFELLNLARTHPETAELTGATLTAVTDQVHRRASDILPRLAARPGFRDDMDFVLGGLRDAALMHHIGTLDRSARPWPVVRNIALRLLTR